MPVIRIYVPIGRGELEELSDGGALRADPERPVVAFAVTEALSAGAPGLDVEDLEYAAFTDAVKQAYLARAVPGDRRVVVAADADPGWITGGEGTPVSAVRLVAPMPVSRVAAFHVDEDPGAAPQGTSADAADAADAADQLLWYDVTELEDVRALLG